MAAPEPVNTPVETRRRQRLIALALLAFLAFNYPLVALFGKAIFVFGIPLLYLYIFAIWLLVIALIARAVDVPNDEAKRD